MSSNVYHHRDFRLDYRTTSLRFEVRLRGVYTTVSNQQRRRQQRFLHVKTTTIRYRIAAFIYGNESYRVMVLKCVTCLASS